MAKRKSMTQTYLETPLQKIPKSDLPKVASLLTSSANKRITALRKAGYEPINRRSEYNLSNKTGYLIPSKKNQSDSYYLRKIKQAKAFLNRSANTVSGARRDMKKLGLKTDEYKEYRKLAGLLYDRLDYVKKYTSLQSDEVRDAFLEIIKVTDSPQDMMRQMRQKAHEFVRDDRIQAEFEMEKLQYMNGEIQQEPDIDSFMKNLSKDNPELFYGRI